MEEINILVVSLLGSLEIISAMSNTFIFSQTQGNSSGFLESIQWWSQIIGGLGTFVTLLLFLVQRHFDRKKKEEEFLYDRWKKKQEDFDRKMRIYTAINGEIQIYKSTFEPSNNKRVLYVSVMELITQILFQVQKLLTVFLLQATLLILILVSKKNYLIYIIE